MNTIKAQRTQETARQLPLEELPWYRQFWPWFIIAIPACAVAAGLFTFWLAIRHPHQLVVDEDEYRRLNDGLKAQKSISVEQPESATGETGPDSG